MVVTGAAGGIGRALCTALSELGARVVAVDRTAPEAAPRGAAIAADLADLQTHSGIISAALKLGTFKALFNLAAILIRTPSIDEVTEAD